MRLAFFGNPDSVHLLMWAREAARAGHEVHVVAQGPSAFPQEFARLHVVPVRPERGGSWLFPVRWLRTVRAARRVLRDVGPDLIQVFGAANYPFIGAERLPGKPVVVMVFGSDVYREPRRDPVRRALIRGILRRADRVLVTSARVDSHLVQAFQVRPERIQRIPWGIEVDRFRRLEGREADAARALLGLPDGPMVFACRPLDPVYRNELLLEAWPAVVAEVPSARLVFLQGLAPDGSAALVRARAQALGVADSVRVLPGFQPQERMALLFGLATAFASLPATDQFALSLMEGMAAGALPVISPNPNYGQYLEDGRNALVADPTDAAALAAALVRALRDGAFRTAAAALNRRIIREHEDRAVHVRQWMSLYRELARPGHAG